MTEAGFINDSRCSEALNILESKRLKSGGWKEGGKYYKISKYGEFKPVLNFERVNWGRHQKSDYNEWITTEALYVLSESGRIKI